MTSWECIAGYLPKRWMDALQGLSFREQDAIQELRLRAEQPVTVSTPAGLRFLLPHGLTAVVQPGVLRCSARQLEACFLRCCEESVYAHEKELHQGYIALPGGIRVGVAGSIAPGGVSQVSSLCLRLPRVHRDSSRELLPYIDTPSGLENLLLVGQPSSGKTSLLRDLASRLSCRWRVAVVDERGELSGMNGLPGCDVLRGYPKGEGILQAVRTLAPDVVIFDELGEGEEIRAVAACGHAGVAVAASLHGSEPCLLQERPAVQMLIRRRMFSRWVFLTGRHRPGQIRECLQPEVVLDEICWHGITTAGGDRPWAAHLPTALSAASPPTANRPVAVGSIPEADPYSSAPFYALATTGRR